MRYAVQAPSAVVMIRPHAFESNPETQADNAFQKNTPAADRALLAQRAHEEVTQAAQTLAPAEHCDLPYRTVGILMGP